MVKVLSLKNRHRLTLRTNQRRASAGDAFVPHAGNFASVHQMVQWPTVLTSLCFDGATGLARRQRVLENCQFGLTLYTEFSGKFTVEVCLSMLANAFDDVALGLPPN